MSFSGQSNPPWQRNNLNNVLQGQIVAGSPSVTQLPNAGLSFHQGATAPMFLQQPQQNMTFGHGSLPPTSIGTSGMFQQGSGASVSYPQSRSGLNPVAFQNSPTNSQPTSQTRSQQQYNSIGTITKMNGDCGLVNDEILFYRNVCKGPIPKLGERVIFEASYNPNGQFKWNASRIQIMPQPRLNSSQPPPLITGNSGANNSKGSGSGYNAVPPPNDYQRSQQQRRASPRRSSPGRDRHPRNEKDRRDRDRNVRSRDRDDDEHDRKRRREDRDRSKDRTRNSNAVMSRSDRDRDRERDRDEIKRESDLNIDRRDRERERERTRERERERDRDKERERSPVHRMGQKTRRTRTIRRYMVQIPKSILTFKSADIQELRQRYSTLYIPSDFFHADIKWSDSFTHTNPFSLRRPCQFHIMHKIVEPLRDESSEVVEPEDANYLYSAKVMLMSCPPIAEMYQKCFEDDDNENEQHTVHPSRLISFLVGTRGRNEPMAIGGPWSPSLDGENPDKDPSVLIRTAIRTCKALTGIDLSNCTQWYRFVELYYHRTDHKNKDKDGPPRIETVVIYLPDVHSCIPTISEWENLTQSYKVAVENVVSRKIANQKSSSGSGATGSATLANDFNPDSAAVPDTSTNVEAAEEESNCNPDLSEDNKEVMDVSVDGDDNENEKDTLTGPTHYSKLDLKTMKLQEIRNELDARNLPSKGARNLLMARLAKAVNTEKADGDSNSCDEPNDTNNSEEADVSMECDSAEKKLNTTKTNAKAEEKEDDHEENEDWADVDMNDIVILDEYDSSKNPDDGNKELDEKEKLQLIRRYTLPSVPHVIVHPSKSAKGGKFDCSVMSLSVLLDYRPEDTKERFFEVSLFAELFNEMLMRDFGFNIYKELYLQKEASPVEPETTNESTTIKKEEIKPNEEDEPPKDNNGAIESKQSIDNSNEKKERRISKHSVDMDPDDDNQSINSSADRKRKTTSNASDKKMVVVKPQLLLSFVYFDTSHCGYIFEKDLEDLFSILGLNLSRGQIRKVLGKSASRHAFYYRKLTEKEESIDAPPTIEESDEISNEELRKLALGNKLYYPIFKNEAAETSDISNDTKVTDNHEGLVNYKGAVVHVGKLMEQIKRTEINYSDLEKLYNDLSKQYADLQKEHSKSSGKIKDLQSEVKSLNRKLSDTDQDLYTINRKYKDQQSTLSYIYNRVSPYFNRDKDHKSESSRDKDGDKGEKNKEKDNDKLKESRDKDKTQKKEDEKDKKGLDKDKKVEDIKESLETEISVEEGNKTEDAKNE